MSSSSEYGSATTAYYKLFSDFADVFSSYTNSSRAGSFACLGCRPQAAYRQSFKQTYILQHGASISKIKEKYRVIITSYNHHRWHNLAEITKLVKVHTIACWNGNLLRVLQLIRILSWNYKLYFLEWNLWLIIIDHNKDGYWSEKLQCHSVSYLFYFILISLFIVQSLVIHHW